MLISLLIFFIENDTLARIGSSCLQQLILANVKKLDYDHWGKVSATFVQLFESTTPYNLLDEDHHFIEAANGFIGEHSGKKNFFLNSVDTNFMFLFVLIYWLF